LLDFYYIIVNTFLRLILTFSFVFLSYLDVSIKRGYSARTSYLGISPNLSYVYQINCYMYLYLICKFYNHTINIY